MNVYYDVNDEPNSYGLSWVGTLDEPNLSYEYHTLLVVQHTTGRLFYAEDSGCSCPTPFEDFHFESPDDNNLTEITKGDSFESFTRDVESFPVVQSERDGLLYKVKQLLK